MKKLFSIVLCLLLTTLLLSNAVLAASFPDVDGYASYAEAVDYLKDVGIMQGDDKGNFNPNKAVTRAEMAKIICLMLGQTNNLNTSNTFFDVPETYWANKYIVKAAELGIINGYGDRRFGPSDAVTCGQAVTMVIRAIGGESEATNAGGYPNGFISVANQYGFLDNIQAEISAPFSRANIAIMIYNSLGFSFNEAKDTYDNGEQTD